MNSVGTRDEFIQLLEQLGAEDDQLALATARELHRRVVEEGDGWDALLVSDDGERNEAIEVPDEDDLTAEDDRTAEEDLAAEDDLTAENLDEGPEPIDEVVEEIELNPDAVEASAADRATLERLLRRTDISEATREELEGLRSDIADGTFSEMDASYLRALAQRLGRK